MTHIATITSKKQLTLPAKIFRAAGLKEGQKVIVKMEHGKVVLIPAVDAVKKLAGSVQLPKRLRGKDIDEVIELAKKDYFQNKK